MTCSRATRASTGCTATARLPCSRRRMTPSRRRATIEYSVERASTSRGAKAATTGSKEGPGTIPCTAAKAKKAQLKNARAVDPAADPGFAERQAARQALSIAREARAAERKAAKEAEALRKAQERAAEAEARALALVAEEDRLKAEAAEEERRAIALEAERKAARDAKYAARKARQW